VFTHEVTRSGRRAVTPRICVVHNNVDRDTSIGAIARWNVTVALELGWRVMVVARDLDPELKAHVEWSRLWVPPIPHLGQWLAARATVKRALRDARFDLLHVHQPQVAALADVWQVHYLSRPARDHDGFAEPTSLRGRVLRLEQYGVMLAEDTYLRRLHRAATRVLFVSSLLRDEFASCYRLPRDEGVLPPPAGETARTPATPDRRAKARAALWNELPPEATVLGFLGGTDPRKGYRELLDAVAGTRDVFLLFAGTGSAGLVDARIGDRVRGLGYVRDLDTFFDAIDALAVPSRFDPAPVVVDQALSRATPVVSSPMVGSARGLTPASGVLQWIPDQPLTDIIGRLRTDADRLAAGAAAAAAAGAGTRASARLVEHWQELLASPRRIRP
jgi:glycosyltransferase involved in cell wall biosynthesis